MSFQTFVNLQLPVAMPGDFASQNPRKAVVPPEAGFVAGLGGVLVARFAWVDPTDLSGRSVLNSGTGAPTGFIAREQQGLITQYLQASTMLIPEGFGLALMSDADVFVLVTVAPAVRGNKAFASLTDGSIQPGVAGATIAGYVETAYVFNEAAAVGELASISKE